MSTLATAIVIAAERHAGQVRKATNEPYIFHPIRAMLRASHFSNDLAIIAVLHDTLEDTSLEISDLEAAGFENHIIEALKCLTHADYEPYDEYILRVKQNPLAQIVKILDIEDNMSDLETLGVERPEDEIRMRRKYTNALKVLRGR